MNEAARAFALMALCGAIFVVRPEAAIRQYQRTIDSGAKLDPRHIRIGALIWTVAALAMMVFRWNR